MYIILYNYYIRTKISVDILRFPEQDVNHNNNIILNMINSSVENKN